MILPPIIIGLLKVVAIIFLVFLNGFFVACEFAIVKVRHSRINTLAQKGDIRAKFTQSILKNVNAYLSAAQLGITIASLGLGWLGEPFVARLIRPLFELSGITSDIGLHWTAGTIAFIIITSLHIILGEQAPKSFSLQYAEPTVLWISIPLRGFYYLFYPGIWVLNESSNLLLRLLKLPTPTEREFSHTPEELKMILKESSETGELSTVGARLMQRVLTFTTRTVKDIMVPRTNIIGLEIHATAEKIMEIAIEHGYSRMPVYDQTLDKILGIVYIKDFLALEENRNLIHLSDIMRPAYFIPENIKVGQLLREFQKRKLHMAVVVDEYGVTIGLVTMEDVIEEIVGEIQDEYDTEEDRIQKAKDGTLIVDGTISINDLNQYYGIRFPDIGEFESISGFVLSRLGKIPSGGETIQYEGQTFTVVDVHSNRIMKVKITPLIPSSK